MFGGRRKTAAMPSGNRERDAALQAMLTEHHVRKDEPHSADFFLHFRDKASADAAAEALLAQGFSTKVDRIKSKLPWCCEASKSTPVDEATIDSLREMLEKLAASHGGYYDGWGCSLNEGEGP